MKRKSRDKETKTSRERGVLVLSCVFPWREATHTLRLRWTFFIRSVCRMLIEVKQQKTQQTTNKMQHRLLNVCTACIAGVIHSQSYLFTKYLNITQIFVKSEKKDGRYFVLNCKMIILI